jgi:hypothetical protein
VRFVRLGPRPLAASAAATGAQGAEPSFGSDAANELVN